jgi:hypothetical protein
MTVIDALAIIDEALFDQPALSFEIRKDKREPLDMRCGLSRSSARRGIYFSFRRPA